MFICGPFRIPAGVLVLLILCTQLFDPPGTGDPVLGSIQASTPGGNVMAEEDVNGGAGKMAGTPGFQDYAQMWSRGYINDSYGFVRISKGLTSWREDIGTLVSHYTWPALFRRWLLILLLFMVCLYLMENVQDFFFPEPRRLKLDNSYLTNDPPEVGPEIALTYDTPWTIRERIKLVFFLITGLLFLRIFLVACFGLLAITTMSMVGWRGRTRRDNALWFLFWSSIASLFGNLAGISAGVYHIKAFGKVADGSECKIIIANHSCVMEVVYLFMYADFPSFVTREENCNDVPFFGAVAKALDAIVVDRRAAESRQQTVDAIKKRATCEDPHGSQLIIFPEGTTANQRALFLFKRGAMEPGAPVQMICICFPYKHFNPCWTGRMCGGNNTIDLVLRTCSQFVTRVELRVLPVYTPTLEEKSNTKLYAEHCQKMMAIVLQCGTSSCTYSDYEALTRSRTAKKAPVSSRKVRN